MSKKVKVDPDQGEFMAREKISKAFKLNLVLQVLQQKLSVKEVANTNFISER